MSSKLFGVMVIAFAMIATMAFIGCSRQESSPGSAMASNNAPNVASPPPAQPEAVLLALPVNELPLWPDEGYDHPIVILFRPWDSDHLFTALVSVVVDGYKMEMRIWGSDPEKLVTFKLRTDGWKHASAQFFGKNTTVNTVFSSAVILVPDEESLKLWNEWYTKQITKARGERTYPSRVLPPK